MNNETATADNNKNNKDATKKETIKSNTNVGGRMPNSPERPAPEDKVPEMIYPPGEHPSDPVRHPADTTATTKYNPDKKVEEDRAKDTEILPPDSPEKNLRGAAAKEKMTADNFNAATVDIDQLPSISDPSEISKLNDGDLFLAKFAHQHTGDEMWHIKQHMDDLVSGKLIKHGLSPEYWRKYSNVRSPVGKKVGNDYVLLG